MANATQNPPVKQQETTEQPRPSIRWRHFGEDAFEAAQKAQKPVFLHIGFPSCHWCHVMERESFQDSEVIALLNESFVCIDVDREQRPDVDAVYMAACQSMTGQGGWPLTALLAPNQQPFFIGTYIPKDDLLALLKETLRQWSRRRDKLTAFGAQLMHAVREQFTQSAPPVAFERRLMNSAVHAYAASFDAEWGGTGIAPKFPMAHTLTFLIRKSFADQDKKALSMAETTLQRMCEGGIFDHVGGGFMRYSTDRRWAEPHYEKMLCDNAALCNTYLEAWQATRRPLYLVVAERTLAYVLREMTSPEGAFYASQDADAQGSEGAYYHLSRAEVISLLGQEDGTAYCNYYSLGLKGNKHPHRIGYEGGIETGRMAQLNARMRAYRMERMPLKRDDKLLTGWNAQMISALAYAYQATGTAHYLDAAARAALFLRDTLQKPDGRLYTHRLNGVSAGEGLLDDYAFLSDAALSLYRATLQEHWLTWAVSLARKMLELFEDRERGGFFLTPHDGPKLIARPKETYDGAQASGNAAALSVLVTLSLLNIGEGWEEAAKRQTDYISGIAADAPMQHMASLTAALPLVYSSQLLEARATPEECAAMLEALRPLYAPLLMLKAAPQPASGSSYWLCKGTVCLPPFQQMEAALAALQSQ